MVGDDLTDEHAFEAAAALGGFGVLVGPVRATAARYRLEDVEAVGAWLGAALNASAA
jgi:trehalose 6-phosphate phosphatase